MWRARRMSRAHQSDTPLLVVGPDDFDKATQAGAGGRLRWRFTAAQVRDDGAISILYHVETQMAEYLERTVYAVRDGKSFIIKFNCRNQIYRAIEGWVDEIVDGFFE